VGSGFDIAAAIWGGTIYYVSPAKIVEPLTIPELPLVVGYTGIKADTPTLVRMVESARLQEPDKINAIFADIAHSVEQARVALETQDWNTAGQLKSRNQDWLAQLGVSGTKLDTLVSGAVESGAWGAKLSGAGGGDCMLALVADAKRQQVANTITELGGQVMDVVLNAPGVRQEESL